MLSSKCKFYTYLIEFMPLLSDKFVRLFLSILPVSPLSHQLSLCNSISLTLSFFLSCCAYLSRVLTFSITQSFSSHLFSHFQYSVLSYPICLCQFITHYSYVTVWDNFFIVFLVLHLRFSLSSPRPTPRLSLSLSLSLSFSLSISLSLSLSLSLSFYLSLSLTHDLSFCVYILHSFSYPSDLISFFFPL